METLLSDNPKIQQLVSGMLDGSITLSFSSIKEFKNSPDSFIRYKFKQKEETPAMKFGSMVHCLILEPELFSERYFVLDDTEICSSIGGAKPRATKAYKEWYDLEISKIGDRIIVEPSEAAQARIVSDAIYNNDAARSVMRRCPQREIGIEWEYMNFKFRGFIDMNGATARADLKIMVDASPKKAQQTIINNGYYLQGAMYNYSDTFEGPYYIIAADRNGGVSVHQLSDHLLEHGLKEYTKLCSKMNECILTDAFYKSFDFWAERKDGIYIADKPAWLYT